jgi:hypothetical protein
MKWAPNKWWPPRDLLPSCGLGFLPHVSSGAWNEASLLTKTMIQLQISLLDKTCAVLQRYAGRIVTALVQGFFNSRRHVARTQVYWFFFLTFPSSGILETRKHDWVGVFSPFHLRTETDPVSETTCFLVSRIPDDGKVPKKPVNLCVIHHRQNPSESTCSK